MNEENRNPEYSDRREPWDQGIYQTGSTRPPKSHGGLIAVLLVLVIFLGGIASALGLLNIRLFSQIQSQPGGDDPPVSFADIAPTKTATDPVDSEPDATVERSTLPTVTAGNVTLDIQDTPDPVANVPQEGGMALQDIYTKAIDSVVSISCVVSGGSASGTGVVLSRDGYIVTNCHVVEDALSIQVQLTDKRVFSAALVGSDAVSDLAVLYVEANDLTPAEFGDSGSLRVGDTVVAIGDPLGVELHGTMTNGIVSAINRDITTGGRTMTLIQTNAALNAGNSGGPLINCYGQVIGINTMKIGDYMSAAGVEGLGFAIPSTTVKEVVDQLIRQGYVAGRPSLGLEGEMLSSFEQLYYRLPQGFYISGVDSASDAAAKGLATGDILISVDGVRITDEDTLNSLIYSHQVGDTVEVVIYRNRSQYTLKLTIGEAK